MTATIGCGCLKMELKDHVSMGNIWTNKFRLI